jgi:hypothetical protein
MEVVENHRVNMWMRSKLQRGLIIKNVGKFSSLDV